MDYAPEEYTRHYIVEALFKLMGEYEYEKISVTDIAAKAGVGRATFYRYFKRKEDVIEFYFSHNAKQFIYEQHYYPRCKADYLKIVREVFGKFANNKERFRLLKKARLEYLYLDFLNRNFAINFKNEYEDKGAYLPYIYSGMVFNVSMRWLESDCADSIDDLAETLINAIYTGE